MTKNTKNRIDDWVGKNYVWLNGQISTNIAKGQMEQHAGDLTIHMIETLYTQDEDKIIQMLNDDMLGRWLLVGASQQLRSSTSPFYRLYRKEKSWSREDGLSTAFNSIFDHPDEEYDDSLMECFQYEYNKLHWYNKELMQKYWYEGRTLQEIHEFYNISKRHITKDINKAINQIRQACRHC